MPQGRFKECRGKELPSSRNQRRAGFHITLTLPQRSNKSVVAAGFKSPGLGICGLSCSNIKTQLSGKMYFVHLKIDTAI